MDIHTTLPSPLALYFEYAHVGLCQIPMTFY